MARLDQQNRTPKVEVLPDMRLRVTDCFDILDYVPRKEALFLADIELPWATPHPQYPNCRLTNQTTSGQIENGFKTPNDPPPQLFRVYEQIPQNDRVEDGLPNISFDQYGNKSVEINWIQFSVGTTIYSAVVGNTAAPSPNGACILKISEATNDGTLIRTKQTFIDRGELSDTETIKFDGRLVIRELTYLNEVPPTPDGWTLITKSTEFVSGLPVYRYGFASAGGGGGGAGTGGVISTEIDYERSPDEGLTGVTRTTIKYISTPDVDDNPITPPAGSVLISVTSEDQDGYRMWTAIYASGQGEVSFATEIRNDGKLIIYSKTAINEPPDAPDPTIGGVVTLIRTDVSNGTRVEDGTVVYDYQWAEGVGEISRDIDYQQSIDQGTIGATRTTIRFLVAPAGTIQPATLAGSVLVGQNFSDQDGYRMWTTVWAKGAGLVVDDVEIKNDGKLFIYHRVGLGTAPTAPAARISGTVTLIEDDQRNADGYVIFERRWAEGVGEISREIRYGQSSDQGTTGTTTTTIRFLVAPAGTIQPATLAGSVLVAQESSDQDGYRVWTTTWAKGAGAVLSEVETKEAGALILYHTVALGTPPDAPDPTIGGTVTLVDAEVRQADGYVIYDYRWAEGLGEVGRTTEYLQSSDAGVTGVTRVTIRALTEIGGTDPTTAPGGDFVEVSISSQSQDGYLLWTAVWAHGTGIVTNATEIKEGGNLIIYRQTELNPAADYVPTAPSATIGGTVTLVSQGVRNSDGYFIYESTWAEGFGTIETSIDYGQSSDQGTTGVTRTTIRALTEIGGDDPTTAPSGQVQIAISSTAQDGYLLWSVVYAKGTGTVLTINSTQNDGLLLLQTIKALGTAPATPSGYTLIKTDVQAGDGYQIFTYEFAKGVSSSAVSSEIEYLQSADQGTTGVTKTTLRYFVVPAATVQPTALTGSVLISQAFSEQDGYRVWTTVWAKGTGLVSQTITTRDDGLREVTNISLGTKVSPDGVEIRANYILEEGFTRYTTTTMQAADGDADPTTATASVGMLAPFRYPGRAFPYNNASMVFPGIDVFRSPPVEVEVEAVATITYQASSVLDFGALVRWNPDDWAVVVGSWVGLNQIPGNHVEPLTGYRTTDDGVLEITAPTLVTPNNQGASILGAPIYGGTTAQLQVLGGPENPDGNEYALSGSVALAFQATDGTKYYRQTIIIATIPTQTPVSYP